ncbi:MAG: ABC transporter ATP-binding protein [Vallitaleaceae bacterium]|nr:ABC transporter ATP-binding protein [Vallitaleaceae bacterium]
MVFLLIECSNLVRIYKTKEIEVVALQGLDLSIKEGEMTAIVGKSGSGKSTLLNIIAGLDRPSAGSIQVAGKDLLSFNNRQLETYNRETIGFVWQNNARNLLPFLSAIENVEVPMMISGRKNRRKRAEELLELVGLSHRKHNKLQQLSGGEQQRVAIAIALANDPKLLLADEPTGSVDEATTYQIMDVFRQLNESLGITMVIVTHDQTVAKMVKRVVSIHDGMIDSELLAKEDYREKLTVMGEITHAQEESHQLFAIIDQKGRIKLPESVLNHVKKEGNSRVILEPHEKGIIIVHQ